MAEFYKAGEQKVRPNLYQRHSKRGTDATIAVDTSVVAVPIQASWGVIGEVTVHESAESIKNTYGTSGTVDAALALFEGKKKPAKVYCYRLDAPTGGTAGVAATVDLNNASSTAVATVSAKYAGTRSLNVSIRSISDTLKEIVVYDGTTKLESFTFASGSTEDEAGNLVAAVATSKFITVTAKDSGTSVVAVIANAALTGGTNPVITTESYSAAFNAFEAYALNYICLDTVDSAVQEVLKAWLNRVYETGKLVAVVLGGTNANAEFATMCAAATACNDKKLIYSGICGYDADDNLVDGYRMAALVCGAIATTPNNESIVHTEVPGIVRIKPFTNTQYEDAIKSGLLLASTATDGTVWFDSGINTLVNPAAEEDDGWKKIRRVATRFEMINRIDANTAPLVGKIDCNNDGIGIFIERAQGVLNEMVKEVKLHAGATIYEDTENPRTGDSAWFVIEADDMESFEKGYLNYLFRFIAQTA